MSGLKIGNKSSSNKAVTELLFYYTTTVRSIKPSPKAASLLEGLLRIKGCYNFHFGTKSSRLNPGCHGNEYRATNCGSVFVSIRFQKLMGTSHTVVSPPRLLYRIEILTP